MNLNMQEIKDGALYGQPLYVSGYKVCVYDVTDETVKDYKSATGEEEFNPDCGHVQFEIYFTDECGVRRGVVEIGFYDNVINEKLGDVDKMIYAGFAEE